MTETNTNETTVLAAENATETVTTPEQETPYAVVVVFSRWTIGQLSSFLLNELRIEQDQIGFMRIDRFDNKETNRTIMLVQRCVLDAAHRKGFTEPRRGLDFRMCEYELREHNYPREGYTTNLFISLPEDLSVQFAREQLENKLSTLQAFGVFNAVPHLAIPLKSRETEEHRKKAYVTFPRDTSAKAIALARVLLHDTRLYLNEESEKFVRMSCTWAWDKQKKTSQGDNQQKSSQKGSSQKVTKGKGPVKGKPAQKTTTKKPVPAKTGPVKTESVPVRALAPGENQWAKPLVTTQDSSECDLAQSTTCCPTGDCLVVCEEPVPVVTEQQVNPLEFPTLK